MDDNIDDLLDDLDALITNKPSSVGTGGGALPFRIPHRPSNEKSPTQQSNPNPKNKFAINPSSSTSSHSHSYNNSYRSGSENVRNQNYPSSSSSSTSTSSGKKDVESIDSLLELLDEPSPQKHMSTSNNHYNRSSNTHHSTSSNTSSYHTSSKGSSSIASSAFPTFNHSNGTNSSSHKSPPKKQDAHDYCYGNSAISDNSFDSLLSDINSSLPPVSPSNDSLHQAQHSKSASLVKPPPQIGTGGAPKGGRCSRVVIAGSEMSRGIKSSAFSKSACDRLRCLKCNFEAIQFPDKAWTSEVDYMFFRNNMPNKSKLTPQLVYKPSSVAYCCQCSWITTQEEVTLSPGQTDKPQWVCAGH